MQLASKTMRSALAALEFGQLAGSASLLRTSYLGLGLELGFSWRARPACWKRRLGSARLALPPGRALLAL
eukprot:scaffold121785_cov45-Phaeocystis_antarctica.AAC.1